LGYDPQVASGGVEALDRVRYHNFDLILMDVIMPEVDGLETTRRIRKSGLRQPFIAAMTANVMPEAKEECLLSGMNDYISKPVDLQELMRIIEKAAEAKQAGRLKEPLGNMATISSTSRQTSLAIPK
jgi:CheY-like chemotaxis protein